MILPLDICREILLLLPVESLFRCRAVCKRWRTVIDDPHFARAHINHLSSHTLVYRTFSPFDSLCTFDLEAINFTDGRLQEISGSFLDLTENEIPPLLEHHVAACNGLLLVDSNNDPLVLEIWNLSTHERLRLPQLPRRCGSIGLGYDYATNDFEAVLIDNNQTHVYSLRSDSWRNIGVCPFMRDYVWDSRGVFLCGALHWMSRKFDDEDEFDENEFDHKILALDLGTEKYRLIQTPLIQNKTHSYFMLLDVLSGCLFLSISQDDHFDVWVMKDYGADDSWFKFFSIMKVPITLYNYLRPLAFMKNKNQVFLRNGVFGYILFDVESNSMKRVHIHHMDKMQYFFAQVTPQSLFRLHGHCGSSGRNRIRRLDRPMKMKVSLTIQRPTFDRGNDGEVSTEAERLRRV